MLSEQSAGKNDGYADLDALVLAEIEALRELPIQSTRQPPADSLKADTHSGAGVSQLRGAPEPREEMSGEEAQALFNTAIDESDTTSGPDEVAGASLLSAEEEAFVTRALGFLAGRESADMILGRIWQSMADANPDGYFRVDEAAADGPSDPPAEGGPKPE